MSEPVSVRNTLHVPTSHGPTSLWGAPRTNKATESYYMSTVGLSVLLIAEIYQYKNLQLSIISVHQLL